MNCIRLSNELKHIQSLYYHIILPLFLLFFFVYVVYGSFSRDRGYDDCLLAD